MNPFLPLTEMIPDAEARVWADGRLYLYGSLEQAGVEAWCSGGYKVFSTADLVTWTDHGISFDISQVGFSDAPVLFAPDCVYYRGRYYLFFCMPGGREGVAVADGPAGPFGDASPVAGADGLGIDPAVLVDDDGRAYLYWGQDQLYVAQLAEDLRSIVPETLRKGILTGAQHGFHEGASIRKFQGRYYLVYCDDTRGRASCLSYATADSPFGPFERKGVIIDNANCDPLSWNNHGSLCAFNGQWYIFYHRSSGNSRHNRRACMEPITIHPDGGIDEVRMTSSGAERAVDATRGIDSERVCSLYGRIYLRRDGSAEFLHSEGSGNKAVFRYYQFRGQTRLRATVRGHGRFSMSSDSMAAPSLVEIAVDSADSWSTIECTLGTPLSGVRCLYLDFAEGRVDLLRIEFS
jgi:arabinoxylan arabinofuranohydrolase